MGNRTLKALLLIDAEGICLNVPRYGPSPTWRRAATCSSMRAVTNMPFAGKDQFVESRVRAKFE
jgi:hypothetical protein